MGSRSEEALKLLRAGFLPIPSKNKHPCVPHKPRANGPVRWTRDQVASNLHLFEDNPELGVLCDNGVFVVRAAARLGLRGS